MSTCSLLLTEYEIYEIYIKNIIALQIKQENKDKILKRKLFGGKCGFSNKNRKKGALGITCKILQEFLSVAG